MQIVSNEPGMPLKLRFHDLHGENGRLICEILKNILPNAPISPVTLNGGMKMPSWYLSPSRLSASLSAQLPRGPHAQSPPLRVTPQ